MKMMKQLSAETVRGCLKEEVHQEVKSVRRGEVEQSWNRHQYSVLDTAALEDLKK